MTREWFSIEGVTNLQLRQIVIITIHRSRVITVCFCSVVLLGRQGTSHDEFVVRFASLYVHAHHNTHIVWNVHASSEIYVQPARRNT